MPLLIMAPSNLTEASSSNNATFFWPSSNDTANNTTNNSTTELVAEWTLIPSFSVGVLIAAGIGNGTVLLLFMRDKNLKNPFNVYLLNLLMANLIYTITQTPLDIINNLYNFAWWLGSPACTVYLYSTYILQAGMCNCHVLITVNRIWAITRPISYKNVHNTKVAVLVCLSMWVYVHVFVMPGFMADALYYRLPLDVGGCALNTAPQPDWALALQIVVYNMTAIIIVGSYPIIFWKKWTRDRAMGRVVPTLNSTAKSNLESDQQKSTKIIDEAAVVVNEKLAVVGGVGRCLQGQKKGGNKRKSNSFLVLTLLTGSVAICWTPLLVYYTIQIFNVAFSMPEFYQVATMLFSLETVTDPILFTIAMKDLRESFKKLFKAR